MNPEQAFSENRGHLWGLCYRMTGSAADAEDLVQETFVRALQHPPADSDRPWRPWLVRVAMNLSCDHLRHRQSAAYVGPWLPGPIDTSEETPPGVEPRVDGRSTEARYEMLESVSFAFLLALEALSPAQRAVLLLRDVFDYTVRETAESLEFSEANVKVLHHRAREAMRVYDGEPRRPSRDVQERTLDALTTFLSALADGDAARAEMLLAADVRLTSDGGGYFAAALRPVLGADRVMRFFVGVLAKHGGVTDVEFRMLNGMPAVIVASEPDSDRIAPVFVLRCDIDGEGHIREFHTVLSPEKLTGLRMFRSE